MISNPSKCGNVFAVHGPPGVGKTTIIKDGMSKALNLPFAYISLGGATDSSYLDGHGYTYEGSIPGKIVDVISKVKCLNPIIYFDELDKISKTSKGEEIANLLKVDINLRSVDVTITRLRKKINTDNNSFLKTIRGKGYMLVSEYE